MEAAVFSETWMFACRYLLGMDKWRFRANRQWTFSYHGN